MLNPDAKLNPKIFVDDVEQRPTRDGRAGFAPVIILIVLVVGVLATVGYFFFKKAPVLQAPIPDVSAWQIYNNYFYNFELKYPADWELGLKGGISGKPEGRIEGFAVQPSTSGRLLTAPSGNPNLPFLAFAPSYALTSLVQNVSPTSTARFLAEAYASAAGAKFQKAYDVRIGTLPGQHNAVVGAYDAYELYGIDRGSASPKTELIFMVHNGVAMTFEFVVAETPADKYEASPAENNVIAREIINTLTFTK